MRVTDAYPRIILPPTGAPALCSGSNLTASVPTVHAERSLGYTVGP